MSRVKGAPSALGGETFSHLSRGIQGGGVCINKPCFFVTNLLPQAHTSLSRQFFISLLVV